MMDHRGITHILDISLDMSEDETMPESPQKDDPEGTASMSKREYQQRMDRIARDFIGEEQPKKNEDPEGTEKPK
jgi:hypothetical protein